jgi:hypothetical protein
MPALVVAVVAFAASAAVSAAIGGVAGTIIGAVVGAVVSYGISAALGLNRPAKATSASKAADNKQSIRAPIAPRRVIYGTARVGGSIVYVCSAGPDQAQLYMVIVLAGHPCESIDRFWINEDEVPVDPVTGAVTVGKYANQVAITKFLGDQTEGDLGLAGVSPDGWSGAHVLRGCTYIRVSLYYSRNTFSGVPNVTALVRGKKDIVDPRTGIAGWTDNWALCVRDYLTSPFGMDATAAEIDDASFIAAANLSDEAVSLNEAGTEAQPRYRLNGSFGLDEKPIDISEAMLSAGAGSLVYIMGQYRLYGGAYTAPSASLDLSDPAGPIQVQTRPPRAEMFNVIGGTFVSPENFYQAAEFGQMRDDAAVAADGGEQPKQIDLPFVTDRTQAQRLARQMLLRSRNPVVVKVPLRYEWVSLCCWQVVSLTVPDLGWSNKAFRITAFEIDPTSAAVTATLQEEVAAAYAWLYDKFIPDGDNPENTLISPIDIPAPTGVTVSPSTALQGDGAVVPALLIEWVPSSHAFVTAHEVAWRVSGGGDGDWNTIQVNADTNRALISPVMVGTTYNVRVRAVASLARSQWTAAVDGTGAPDTEAPGLPTLITATGILRGVSLSWTLPTALDFAAVEVYENTINSTSGRYYVGQSSGSGFIRTGLPPSTQRWYWLRSRDRSGNLSAYVGPVNATSSVLLVDDIGDGIINTAKFAQGIKPVVIIPNLSAVADDGTVAVNALDNRLYTRVGGQWVPTVQALGPGGTLTSDQIESLAAAKLAGQITDTQITDGAISTPKLAAGSVVAGKIAGGAVTTEKLSVGGGNLIWNSCLTRATDGWVASQYGGSPSATLGSALANGLQTWVPRAIGGGYLHVPSAINSGQGAFTDWTPDTGQPGIPVVAGEKIQARALLGTHRCSGRLDVVFLDGFFAQVGGLSSTPTTSPLGGTEDNAFASHSIIGTVPATAVLAVLRLVMTGTSQNDPYLFFSKTMIGRAPANATEVADWTPGGVTEISGGQLRTNSVQAEVIAANAITTDKLAANSVTFGKVAAGAIRAEQIVAGEIKATHLAAEEIISQSIQVKDLIVGTEKITGNAITDISAISQHNNITVPRQDTHNVIQGVVGLTVTVPGNSDGRVIVMATPGVSYSLSPGETYVSPEGGS